MKQRSHTSFAVKCVLAITASFFLFSCMTVSASGVPSPKTWDARFTINGIAVSPEGHIVAVDYHDRKLNLSGIVLSDLQSGKLTRIPAPPGKTLASPSFSPDGKWLTASMSGQLTLINLSSLQLMPVATAEMVRYSYSIFQPGTSNILYVASGAGVWNHLRLFNLKDHSDRMILDSKNGFSAILNAAFVGPDEIMFSGIGPADPRLIQEVATLTRDPITIALPYRLRLGGQPEIDKGPVFQIIRHTIQLDSIAGQGGITNIAASQSGKVIVFIDHSFTDPNFKGQYNYEIFKLENGTVKQITNMKSFMAYIAISADGSTVAFGIDPERNHNIDLGLLDMHTGKITYTGLLERLAANPDFSIQ